MKHTPYLIQRLQKPYNNIPVANIFTFGCGLVNGGLSDNALKLLQDIWRYDYMGSSEFEWGAIPKSLRYIGTNHEKFIIGQFEVTGKANSYKTRTSTVDKNTTIVYYVCEKEYEQEVKNWIEKFADDSKRDYQTKEWVGLAGSILGQEYKKDTVGWHDIDNHYLFFTDKEMFDKFTKLFAFSEQEEKVK